MPELKTKFVGLYPPDYELSDEEMVDQLIEASARTKKLGKKRNVFYWRGVVLSSIREVEPPFGLGIAVRAKVNTRSYHLDGMDNFVRAGAGEVLTVRRLLYNPVIGWMFEATKWEEHHWLPFQCADFEPVEENEEVLVPV